MIPKQEITTCLGIFWKQTLTKKQKVYIKATTWLKFKWMTTCLFHDVGLCELPFETVKQYSVSQHTRNDGVTQARLVRKRKGHDHQIRRNISFEEPSKSLLQLPWII